jgi:hypothetical protein
MQRIIAVATTSNAREARRRERGAPKRERERRGGLVRIYVIIPTEQEEGC